MDQLREWLNEELAFAQEQLEKSKTEDPNSYGHGYDKGISLALQSVLIKIRTL